MSNTLNTDAIADVAETAATRPLNIYCVTYFIEIGANVLVEAASEAQAEELVGAAIDWDDVPPNSDYNHRDWDIQDVEQVELPEDERYRLMPPAQPDTPSASLTTVLADIAREHLLIDTLDTRNSDHLDFHDVTVWSVKQALERAYRAGQADAAGPAVTAIRAGDDISEEGGAP